MILVEKENCCGCLACVNVCPKQAISVKIDDEGFSYPEINSELCVKCMRCASVCSRLAGKTELVEEDIVEQQYYAVKNVNQTVVNRSSSGGVFTALSDYILSQQGVVYGVYMDENFRVKHGRAIDTEMRDQFCGSKYVQSDMTAIYQAVENDLNEKYTVLFVGTPCQVSAIKKYLDAQKVDRSNLYTVDFICHGVASPLIWKEYVAYIEKKYGQKLETYIFRGKEEGWHNWYPIMEIGNGNSKEKISKKHKKKESFILMYQSLVFTRRNCFHCEFTDYGRVSDLTLADFWNIKSIAPRMDDNTGTSEVLVNKKKGRDLLRACAGNLKFVECSKKDAWQPHLEYPNAMPGSRDKFWKTYYGQGFEQVIKLYGRGDFMTRLKNTVTPILKKTGLYVLFGKLYQKMFVKSEGK